MADWLRTARGDAGHESTCRRRRRDVICASRRSSTIAGCRVSGPPFEPDRSERVRPDLGRCCFAGPVAPRDSRRGTPTKTVAGSFRKAHANGHQFPDGVIPVTTGRFVMKRTKLLAGILVGATLLIGAFAEFVLADTSAAALSGTVSSQAEGAMEGVLVGAKRAGSTIAIWVVSNANGRYSFPRDRMEPGRYALSIRAIGYELPSTSVEVTTEP